MGRKKSKSGPLKAMDVVQLRLPGPKKSKWKAWASIYAGGNLSMFIEHCVENAPRQHLILPGTENRKIKRP